MPKTLQEAFPDPDSSICGSFLQTSDVSEKTWRDIAFIAKSDDQTFWTVIANHKTLSLVLRNIINAIDTAHSSVFRHQLQRSDEISLIMLLVRLATTTSVVLRVGVCVSDLARRIGEIITPTLLMSMSLIILRHCGSSASTTITSFIFLNPSYLCSMSSVFASWCDITSRLAVRCVREILRGRHQRIVGDVVSLFEQVYRHVKHIWAIVHCAPFISDYMQISRILQSLRIVVDLISPALQHFILTCTEITNRREQLSKANFGIINAAINTASILVIFRTYCKNSGDGRYYCVDRIVNSTYEALRTHIIQKVLGIPAILLSDNRRSMIVTLHELVPPQADIDDLEIGKLLKGLTCPIPDSKDFDDGFAGTRLRYFELLLLELVNQGLHIDLLLEKKFITILEAEELGASEKSITKAISGIIEESCENADIMVSNSNINNNNNNNNNAKLNTPATSEVYLDPLVSIVLDVMPHFNVKGIVAALKYYNNDVEHFILDASMDNIVPHLLEQLTEPSPHISEGLPDNNNMKIKTKNIISDNSNLITSADYDEKLREIDLNLFIGRDLYDSINDGNQENIIEEFSTSTFYTTHQPTENCGGDEMFEVDEAMREKIRMLAEILYDDEYDDAQEVTELRGLTTLRGANDLNSSCLTDNDNCEIGFNNNNNNNNILHSVGISESVITPSGVPHCSRTLYDDKRYHETRSKRREQELKSAKATKADVPAYTQKKKTLKKKMQDKMAFTRAVKKGKTEF